MIIRAVSIVSLMMLLVLVLYLPSAHPPEHFIGLLRIEHELNAKVWGHEYALRMLSRMLALHAQTQQASPLPQTFTAPSAPGQIDGAVAAQLLQMTSRLVHNPYLRSLDALLALASYRLAVFLEWLPFLLVFVVAAVCDGAVRRIVKSKEFRQHSPERYALSVSMAIMLACGTVVAFVLPLTLHPVVLPAMPVGIGVFANIALGNFHVPG